MFYNFFVAFCLSILCLACKNDTSPPPEPEELTQTTETHPTGNQAMDTEEGRFAWQKPELVIQKLGDIQGKIIADIGAGTGYFTFRLIRKAEKVIAVDIDPNMIELIEIFRENLDTLQQARIETRLASPASPNLGEEEIDIAIIINTIGYIEDRKTYLQNLRKSLKTNGEIMIVDFKMKRIPDNIAPAARYRVNILELENLLDEIGFQLIVTDDRSLDYQFILKARKV